MIIKRKKRVKRLLLLEKDKIITRYIGKSYTIDQVNKSGRFYIFKKAIK